MVQMQNRLKLRWMLCREGPYRRPLSLRQSGPTTMAVIGVREGKTHQWLCHRFVAQLSVEVRYRKVEQTQDDFERSW